MTRVISIQSQVVHGHVGNSAAVFPLQACGIEVAAVPTTLLSNIRKTWLSGVRFSNQSLISRIAAACAGDGVKSVMAPAPQRSRTSDRAAKQRPRSPSEERRDPGP